MNPNEILKLIDAGFSADEIRTMMAAPAPAAPEASPEEPAPATDPEPAADQKQPGLDAVTALNTLLSRLDQKLDQIQAANTIFNASSAGSAQDPTADDIIEDLIYPK